MKTKHTMQTHTQQTLTIPLEEVLALLPAEVREGLAGWEVDCYVDCREGEDHGGVLLIQYSQRREYEYDADQRLVEIPQKPRDMCVRKSEVEALVAAAIETKEPKP